MHLWPLRPSCFSASYGLFVKTLLIRFTDFHGKPFRYSELGQFAVNMQRIQEVSNFVHDRYIARDVHGSPSLLCLRKKFSFPLK